MATVQNLIDQSQKLNLQHLIQQTMEDSTSEYETLQQDQMLAGLASNGTEIGLYANESYATMKEQLNPLAGFGQVDLRLTGAFFRGIRVEVGSDSFKVDSSDEKNDALVKKYGEVIFGLDDDYQTKFNLVAQETLIESVKEKLGL